MCVRARILFFEFFSRFFSSFFFSSFFFEQHGKRVAPPALKTSVFIGSTHFDQGDRCAFFEALIGAAQGIYPVIFACFHINPDS